MLREVKASESNPPLYYALAWGWAKAFGTSEVGLRSLSALFGAATVPVAYLIGRELASRRAGLAGAAIVAVNPMLIWYSQEARSYALLIFFAALSLLFFARALHSRSGVGPGALGPCLGARPLQPLLRRLRDRDRGDLAAGRAARPPAGGPRRDRRRRRGRAGAAAPDPRPGQPHPHRLDRTHPPRHATLRGRRQLPGRGDRPRDRRAAARPLRADPRRADRRLPCCWSRCAARAASGVARRWAWWSGWGSS